MKLRFSLQAMLAAAILLLVASCTKESDELLQFVPKNTKMVIVTSPLDLAKKADLQNLDLKKADAKDLEKAKNFFAGNLGVDPEKIVVFEHNKDVWAVFRITDEAKLKAAIDAEASQTVGGFTVVEKSSDKVVINDGIGWWNSSWAVDAQKAADTVAALLKLKEDESIVAKPGFSENMEGADVSAYINMASIYEEAKSEVHSADFEKMPYYDLTKDASMYLSAKFEKEELVISSRMTDKEGNNIADKIKVGKLDSSMLDFFGDKAAVVLAANCPADMWDFLKEAVADEVGGDPMVSGIASTLFSCLEGNIALGGTLSNVSDYYGNDYMLVMKMKPGSEKTIGSLLQASMMLTPDSKGEYQFPVDSNLTVRLGFKGSYMYLTNAPVPVGNLYSSTPNAKKFSGKTGAAVVDFSSGTVLSGALTMLAGESVSGYIYAYSETNGDNKLILHLDSKESNILTHLLKIVGRR